LSSYRLLWYLDHIWTVRIWTALKFPGDIWTVKIWTVKTGLGLGLVFRLGLELGLVLGLELVFGLGFVMTVQILTVQIKTGNHFLSVATSMYRIFIRQSEI